jgi:ABC-type transport system involved in cytochrome c biogenesis permease component
MTFLPIVERELRVTARRSGTYWMRLTITAAAMIVCFWSLEPDTAFQNGKELFAMLAGVVFVLVLLAGVHTTADCLSRERREGTLGLLFLTDLKGYDVVLGKLAATSLNTFYSLVGMLPVMAVPILLGGITLDMFAMTALALVNALWFSLAAGMVVSVFCYEDRTAAVVTFAVVLCFTAAPPLLGGALRESPGGEELAQCIAMISPTTLAQALGSTMFLAEPTFWPSLGVNFLLSSVFLITASRKVTQATRVKESAGRFNRYLQWWRDWHLGNPTIRAARRVRMLAINPVFWLSNRDRWLPFYPWLFVGTMALVWGWGYSLKLDGMLGAGAFLISYITTANLKYWFGVAAAHGIGTERDAGGLELLLSTPLTVGELLRGQALSLQWAFAWPFAAVVLGQLWFVAAGANEAHARHDGLIWTIPILLNIVVFITDCWALRWMGAWEAVRRKTAQRAALATVSRILWAPTALTLGFALPALVTNGPRVLGVVCWLWFGLSLAVDLPLAHRARAGLRQGLRRAASEQDAPGGTASDWWHRAWSRL